MINVTKTFLPPIEEYTKQVKRAWDNQWITNRGELVLELEEKLKNYLSVSNILITNNGTIPLQIALKLLGKEGEIITTPFSYVATTSAIVWENCTPVFVDIHPEYLTIDETKIEAAITNKTTAILVTHVFGNPCDVEAIDRIAKKHNLKVIYDAAHAFGVKVNGKSIFEYGDISTTSFHATKLFHTTEGGAIITKDAKILRRISLMRSFGHLSPTTFEGVGINGKNSEFHAAMGLCNLKYIENILQKRKQQVEYYNLRLEGLNVHRQLIHPKSEYNYSYYPIVFESEELLLKVIAELQNYQIFPRRYFYPSLNTLSYLKDNISCTISEKIARGSLCLPLFYTLSKEEQYMVCRIILRVQNN